MAIYYILTKDGTYFQLDSTEGMQYSENGRLTEYKVEDGSIVSDHYINEAVNISMSGIITDLKVGVQDTRKSKTTDEYIRGIRNLKQSRVPFSVIWRDDSTTSDEDEGNTYRLGNCMFTTIDISQDVENGYAHKSHSYKVKLSFQQFRSASQADIVIEEADFLSDKVVEQSRSTGAPKPVVDSQGEELPANKYSECTKRIIDGQGNRVSIVPDPFAIGQNAIEFEIIDYCTFRKETDSD